MPRKPIYAIRFGGFLSWIILSVQVRLRITATGIPPRSMKRVIFSYELFIIIVAHTVRALSKERTQLQTVAVRLAGNRKRGIPRLVVRTIKHLKKHSQLAHMLSRKP